MSFCGIAEGQLQNVWHREEFEIFKVFFGLLLIFLWFFFLSDLPVALRRNHDKLYDFFFYFDFLCIFFFFYSPISLNLTSSHKTCHKIPNTNTSRTCNAMYEILWIHDYIFRCFVEMYAHMKRLTYWQNSWFRNYLNFMDV